MENETPDPCRRIFHIMQQRCLRNEAALLFCFGVVSRMKEKEMIVNALAILIGDYAIYRKKAAALILKALLPKSVYEGIMRDGDVYPFERDDKRVSEWKRKVLEPGACAFCGSTKQLEAHHVIAWAEWPQGRVDVNNGLCLCHKCHTEEHRFSPAYHMMLARGG